jgi:hypothetical protein
LELANEFTEHIALGIEEAKTGLTKAKDEYTMYSSQQNRSNVFNLWKDALILHEINSGKF